jgi:hypothetical protein
MTLNIWTSLLKSDTKTEIYIPLDLDLNVSLEDFFEAFKTKLTENRINADISIDDVLWDEGTVSQKRIVVRYEGSDATYTNNIQQFLVGLDNIGNFTYVEEKIFLNRPMLPKYPKSRKDLPSRHGIVPPSVSFIIIGIIAGVVGLATIGGSAVFGFICFGVAAYFLYPYSNSNNKFKEAEDIYITSLSRAKEYNDEADTEQKAWDKAWADWDDNVLKTAYLSSTNDIFGRFTRALSSSVKLTIKELFEDKKAELKDRKEKEYSEYQIEEQIAKKKAEVK